MEIGVADGENARKMVTVASENFPAEEVEYYGFDVFRWNNDFQMQQVRQKLRQTGCQFRLFKGDSVETLPEIVKQLCVMDLIFIDGGHSFLTVKSDWENSKALIADKTAVFFHNYDFSGPKRVVDNISRDEYWVKILNPASDSRTARVKKRS
jgi:deoxyribodipyrimidine photolyase